MLQPDKLASLGLLCVSVGEVIILDEMACLGLLSCVCVCVWRGGEGGRGTSTPQCA